MKMVTILTLSLTLTACNDPGPMGPQGVAGNMGPGGAPGTSGSHGTDGVGCTETPLAATSSASLPPQYGGVLLTCSNGSTVITNGASGATGSQGQPGESLQVVQFCPGVDPVYPSTFPEVGVCLDGNIYGVYSANGGFLSELPPGTYNSNGINASCTFTIGENCSVTP